MSLYPELDNSSLSELIQLWQAPLQKREDAQTYYSELAFAIEKRGRSGRDFLASELGNDDEVRLAALLDVLPAPENPLPIPTLDQYLNHKRPMVIAKAIDGLRFQNEKTALAKILTFQNHPAPEVGSSVLRYLSRLFPDRAVPVLVQALNDQDYLVRENAADELDELGAVEAIPQLRKLVNDPHPYVREAAQTALENLSQLATN